MRARGRRRASGRRRARPRLLRAVAVCLIALSAVVFVARDAITRRAVLWALERGIASVQLDAARWVSPHALRLHNLRIAGAAGDVTCATLEVRWRWEDMWRRGCVERISLEGIEARWIIDGPPASFSPRAPAAMSVRQRADTWQVTRARVTIVNATHEYTFRVDGSLANSDLGARVMMRAAAANSSSEAVLTASCFNEAGNVGLAVLRAATRSLRDLPFLTEFEAADGDAELEAGLSWAPLPGDGLTMRAELANKICDATLAHAAVGLYGITADATAALNLDWTPGGGVSAASADVYLLSATGALAAGSSVVQLAQTPASLALALAFSPAGGLVAPRVQATLGEIAEAYGSVLPQPARVGHSTGEWVVSIWDAPAAWQLLAPWLGGNPALTITTGALHARAPVDVTWSADTRRIVVSPWLSWEALSLSRLRDCDGEADGALTLSLHPTRLAIDTATGEAALGLRRGRWGDGYEFAAGALQLAGQGAYTAAAGLTLDALTINIAERLRWSGALRLGADAGKAAGEAVIHDAAALTGFIQPWLSLPTEGVSGSIQLSHDVSWQRTAQGRRIALQGTARSTALAGAARDDRVIWDALRAQADWKGALILDDNGTWTRLDGSLHARADDGEFLWDAVYVHFAEHPLVFKLDGTLYPRGDWSLRSAEGTLGAMLAVAGSGRRQRAPRGGEWEFTLSCDPGPALATVFVPLAAPALAALQDASVEGPLSLKARVHLRERGVLADGRVYWRDGACLLPRAGAIGAAGVELDLPFSLAFGESGTPAATAEARGDIPPGRLSFDALTHPLAIVEPTRLDVRLERNQLTLLAPVEARMWDGAVHVERFRLGDVLRPLCDGELECSLRNLALADVSRVLGAPAFAGRLNSGPIRLRARQTVLALAEATTLNVFGGTVVIESASAAIRTGRLPRYAGSLALNNIDLEQLTSFFSLGSMSGTLEGHARGVEGIGPYLQAFDLDLHSVKTRGVDQSLTAETLQFLASLGGSGQGSLITALYGSRTRIPYSEFGLRARLRDNKVYFEGFESNAKGESVLLKGGTMIPPRKIAVTVSGGRHGQAYDQFVRSLISAYESSRAGRAKIDVKK